MLILQGVWVMTLLPPINTEVGFMDLEVTKIAEKNGHPFLRSPSGLSLCLQFLADLIFFPVAWARFTPSSIALAASCMIFCYAVSYKQVVRAEQSLGTQAKRSH